MASLIARMQRPVVRRIGRRLAAATTPAAMRRVIDRVGVLFMPCAGVDRDAASLGRLPGLRVVPKAGAETGRAFLMFHGGGFVFGSPKMYRHLAGRVAKAAGAVVYIPTYRLAPEHPHPAAIEDGLEAYRAVLDLHRPDRLAVGGDSAGGNLTLAVLQSARNEGLPMPACIVLMSPWTDLTATSDSWRRNVDSELLILPATVERATGWYRGDHAADDPRISPLFGDVAGLPPMLIQVSESELLYSDSTSLADSARSAGVEVEIDSVPDLWHVWQLQAPLVPEARTAIDRAGRFVIAHTSG